MKDKENGGKRCDPCPFFYVWYEDKKDKKCVQVPVRCGNGRNKKKFRERYVFGINTAPCKVSEDP